MEDKSLILFWNKVQVNKDDNCWNWLGGINQQGYGRFSYKGVKVGAHRFSYRSHYGEIPKGICVLHRCDNPKCVRPDHLFLGTHKDNMQDMVKKGRKALIYGKDNYFSNHIFPKSGEENPKSKLTEEDVLNIRKLYSQGISQPVIGKQYGITQPHISAICSRKKWAHI